MDKMHMLMCALLVCILIVLGFNDRSTLVGHFVSSPREWEKREELEERDLWGEKGK